MKENQHSKIKNIFLPLFNYKFDHGPSNLESTNDFFTGRKAIKDRIRLLFEKSKSKHGAYLITGYRGMGKTSVVREALTEDSFRNKKNLKVFNFSLSQDEVRDIDLMRQIGVELISYCNKKIIRKRRIFLQFVMNLLTFFASLYFTVLFFKDNAIKLHNPFSGEELISFEQSQFIKNIPIGEVGKTFLFFGLLAVIMYFLTVFFQFFISIIFKKEIELQNKLDLFNKRLFASVTLEDKSGGIHLGDTNPFTTISNRILQNFNSNNSDSFRNTLNYTPSSSKEIEQYLNNVLNTLNELRDIRNKRIIRKIIQWVTRNKFGKKIPNFIFIIDELDKVEPDYFFAPGDRESDQYLHHNESPFHITTKARKRQEAIAKLLANLKNFLNDAKAKFIFIGGRDIYDASLADIADRESFYSSIFNEVIYVNTFFKDKEKGAENAGLSQLTENFLFKFLFQEGVGQRSRMEKYLNKIIFEKGAISVDQKFKIIHTLQNFFIFLLYRSNGSPKKLIEKYIVRKPEEKIDKTNNWVIKFKDESCKSADLYLKFSYNDQYEINLTSNLYRPYTVINSRHLKSLGDKLLYSSAFLMDHILKFHRTAFSWRNLEMIPDIILANKDPNFRPFFRSMMEFLSNQHIRQTMNAVFQYKFYNKVKNEIEYLSKTSEFSSAAFNFTLDESFHLKSYYKKKLAAKYLEYKDYDSRSNGKEYIHSIGYLHSLIADLHYYDEEFDDAIIHYTDSIQSLREIQAKEQSILDHQFVLYTRNLLNLGLSLEKMQSYDKAYSVYRSLILSSKNFGLMDSFSNDQTLSNDWEKPYKRVQLFLRPHIALLGVIEKQRADGITYDNLERNIKEYSEFLGTETLELFPSPENSIIDYDKINQKKSAKNSAQIKFDKKRIVTLLTDYYTSVGSLLFFKNHIYYRLLYAGKNIPNEKITTEIRSFFDNNKQLDKSNRYRPSHASYLYYLHALVSISAPFYENKYRRTKTGKIPKQPRVVELIEKLDFLFFFLDEKSYPILNSTQNETFGNILSKIGDSLLACIPPLPDNEKLDFIESLSLIASKDSDKLSKIKTRINTFSKRKNLDIELVFLIFYLSNIFFERAEKTYSASFQLKKILYVIRDSSKAVLKTQANLITYCKGLATKILDNLGEVSNSSNRAQISKYRFYTREKEEFTSNIYQGLSTSPEVKEVICLVETIKLKYGVPISKIKNDIGPYSTISSMFSRLFELKLQSNILFASLEKSIFKKKHSDKNFLISMYKDFEKCKKGFINLIGTCSKEMDILIKEMRNVDERKKRFFNDKYDLILDQALEDNKANQTKTKIIQKIKDNHNIKIVEDYLLKKELKLIAEDKFLKNLIELQKNLFSFTEKFNLINSYDATLPNNKEEYEDFISKMMDGLFCCLNSIKILNTYGTGYILTHSLVASFQRMIGLFGIFYELYDFYSPKDNRFLEEKRDQLFSKNSFLDFDPYYHFDMARQSLKRAFQLHSEGKNYKTMNRSMYVLDDDFNDDLTHFCAAMERFTMNSGQKNRTFQRMKKNLSESRLSNYNNYTK